jgi:D-sedoheptulose 7-phosphate isomerase
MNAIHECLVCSRDTIQAALDDPAFAIAIADIVEVIVNAPGDGRKLLLAGNGGSAADAQHLSREDRVANELRPSASGGAGDRQFGDYRNR